MYVFGIVTLNSFPPWYVSTVNLVRYDGSLVHDDVHEVEHVGARLEVEQFGGVPVDDAALGQDLDLHARSGRHDLSHDLHIDLDGALLDLNGGISIMFNCWIL